MAKALTFEQAMKAQFAAERLLRECNKILGTIQSKTNARYFSDIVDDARINANDTVYIERASDDWEEIFRGTIEVELGCLGSRVPGSEAQVSRTATHLRAYFGKL